ncbi:MAG TPA: DinB family protein [Vicinamibacterales bacterium]|nr:DinB family protein [Vicinamibacterales bacterium]
MRKFSICTMMAIALLMLGASAASAQTTPPKAPPTYEQVIVRSWKATHDKILVMAKDTVYPEAKLSYKPHPDSRTVAQELRHVTIGLEATTAMGKGEKYDFEAKEKEYDARPATRAAIVKEMEAAIAASYAVFDAPGFKPVPGLIGWLEHQGEHYGKLVTSYRVNGIVPPISRPKS